MIETVDFGVLGVGTHLKARLASNDTTYILGATIESFGEHDVTYRQQGTEKTAEGFDNIIIAMGSQPYNPLESELRGLAPEVYVIGDAKEVGKANKATEEAAAVAYKI